ncbi:MAG: hypothetical protein KME52_09895 [Desmonostoc geniculatum HA4340-LM1]|jgi:predicted  nucleic acid-binding Zn-ribbon protein|nr:hypothetical protein [Desmonostoc geniculatum HA4340-LM1]
MVTAFTALGLRVFVQKAVGYEESAIPSLPQPRQIGTQRQQRLQELDTEVNDINQQIKAHEQTISNLRAKLQDVKQQQINEAVAFLKAYPELGEMYIHCKEVLQRENNPFRSVQTGTKK